MAKFNVMSADSHLEISPERWTPASPSSTGTAPPT